MISGPGGVGKSTLAKLLAERDGSLELSRSWTTRSPRPGESQSAYTFVTRERFQDRIDTGGFLEWAEFGGNLYGTPLPDDDLSGHDLLLEIDVQGARQIKDRHRTAVVILVRGPSWEDVERRMVERGDSPAQIASRLEIGRREEQVGQALADFVVVNQDLNATLAELAGIIGKTRKQSEETSR